MLDTAFLQKSLTENPYAESLSKDPRAFRSAQLAERGSYVEAAELAQALIDDGSHDVRIICRYLLGLAVERGIGAMADIVPRINRLLAAEFQHLVPTSKRAQAADSALSGLFRAVNQTGQFHASKEDDTWTRWIDSVSSALIERLLVDIDGLGQTLEQLLEAPQSLAQVVRFRRLLKSSLAPAVRRRERARAAAEKTAQSELDETARVPVEPEPAPTPALASAADQVADQGVRAPTSTPAAMIPDGLAQSPALALLIAKLAGFQQLMDKDEVAKAAIVANDIRTIMANFDPVVYLPHLFTDFLERLSTSIEELMPYWHDIDSPNWQALEHFYRADLQRFVGE